MTVVTYLALLADSNFLNSPAGIGLWLGIVAFILVFGIIMRMARGKRRG